MNQTDALNAAVYALRRVVAIEEQVGDDDALEALEAAGEQARQTLEELSAAGFVRVSA